MGSEPGSRTVKRHVFALLALCAVAKPLDWYVSSQFPEEHGYTAKDRAAMDALVEKDDDLLALGRRNATAKAGRKYSKQEAALLIAKIWNVEAAK